MILVVVFASYSPDHVLPGVIFAEPKGGRVHVAIDFLDGDPPLVGRMKRRFFKVSITSRSLRRWNLEGHGLCKRSKS